MPRILNEHDLAKYCDEWISASKHFGDFLIREKLMPGEDVADLIVIGDLIGMDRAEVIKFAKNCSSFFHEFQTRLVNKVKQIDSNLKKGGSYMEIQNL